MSNFSEPYQTWMKQGETEKLALAGLYANQAVTSAMQNGKINPHTLLLLQQLFPKNTMYCDNGMSVKLHGNTEGIQFTLSKATIDLSRLLPRDSDKVEQPTEIFLRTTSGNIYRIYIDTNQKATIQSKKHFKQSGADTAEELPTEILKFHNIILGNPFCYYDKQGQHLNTSNITEIVARGPQVTRSYGAFTILDGQILRSSSSSIVEEFFEYPTSDGGQPKSAFAM